MEQFKVMLGQNYEQDALYQRYKAEHTGYRQQLQRYMNLVDQHTQSLDALAQKERAAQTLFDDYVTASENDGDIDTVYKKIANEQHWKLTKVEIIVLSEYVKTDPFASYLKKYWRNQQQTDKKDLVDIIYHATHRQWRRDFFGEVQQQQKMILYMGMRGIDYPVSGKRVGQTLNGEVFRGMWSTSTSQAVAEGFGGCSAEVPLNGVVFEITVPRDYPPSFGFIAVDWIFVKDPSQHEVIVFDIPGGYVKVFKRCRSSGNHLQAQ